MDKEITLFYFIKIFSHFNINQATRQTNLKSMCSKLFEIWKKSIIDNLESCAATSEFSKREKWNVFT